MSKKDSIKQFKMSTLETVIQITKIVFGIYALIILTLIYINL
jgi:hypothetical protein